MKSKLVKNFKNFIFQEELFEGSERLVVGISGGADSVCLAELLLAVQEKFDLELQLVHINYHLRGRESDEDEKFIRKFVKERGLELDVVNYVKASEGGSNNFEEQLRNFRYKVFENIRVESKFDFVVVAHHQDDQVETFLMNLFRGSGIDGLKGMMIKNEETKILRPLLNFGKQEIKEFLQSIGQEWREDKSNKDNTFLRNRIRNELISEIEKRYSSGFKERVSGVMRQLQKHSILIDREIEKAMKFVTISSSNDLSLTVLQSDEGMDKMIIDVGKYRDLSESIKSLVFRKIVKILRGDLKNISRNNYLEFEKIMRSDKGKRQIMEMRGIKFEKIGKKMKIKK